jgi:hypothetical protein
VYLEGIPAVGVQRGSLADEDIVTGNSRSWRNKSIVV